MTTTQENQVTPEDKLLTQVTRAAKLAHDNTQNLSILVTQCCDEDIDRDDVIEAVMDGGWSTSRARSIVSSIYVASGKRQRRAGAGRQTAPEAVDLAKYATKKFGGKTLARQMLLAAYRYLRNSVTK